MKLLHSVLTSLRGEVVHIASFAKLDKAQSYFEWKSSNLNPEDPKYPADAVRLCSSELVTLKDKGPVAAGPREANSRAREYAQRTAPPRS